MALTRVKFNDNVTINGNVGVSTSSFNSKLEVKGPGGNGTVRVIPASANAEASIGYYQDTTGSNMTSRWVAGVGGWGHTNEFTIGNDAAAKLKISTSGYVTTPNVPSFMAHGNNGWQISAGGSNIPFGGVAFNNSGSYNTSTSKFTAPVAGKYMFITTLYQDNSYDCRLCMTINGAQLSSFGDVIPYGYTRGVATSGQTTLSIQYIANLNLNDYVEVRQRASYGDARIYTPHSHFGGYLIG